MGGLDIPLTSLNLKNLIIFIYLLTGSRFTTTVPKSALLVSAKPHPDFRALFSDPHEWSSAKLPTPTDLHPPDPWFFWRVTINTRWIFPNHRSRLSRGRGIQLSLLLWWLSAHFLDIRKQTIETIEQNVSVFCRWSTLVVAFLLSMWRQGRTQTSDH